jgi:hypothetical protein
VATLEEGQADKAMVQQGVVVGVITGVSVTDTFSEHDDAQSDGVVCLNIDLQVLEDGTEFYQYHIHSKYMMMTYHQGIRNIQMIWC